jgi:hypothetical protein
VLPGADEAGTNLVAGGVTINTVPGFVPDPATEVVITPVITSVPVYCCVTVTYPFVPMTVANDVVEVPICIGGVSMMTAVDWLPPEAVTITVFVDVKP